VYENKQQCPNIHIVLNYWYCVETRFLYSIRTHTHTQHDSFEWPIRSMYRRLRTQHTTNNKHSTRKCMPSTGYIYIYIYIYVKQ